jgi:hypothetical protein
MCPTHKHQNTQLREDAPMSDPDKLITDILESAYQRPLEVTSYHREADSDFIKGLFLDLDSKQLFEYSISISTSQISYRLCECMRELPKSKSGIFQRFTEEELRAFTELVRITEVAGGTVAILNEADFADEHAALDTYGFYPSDLAFCPLIYYKNTEMGMAIGAYLCWGDDEYDSLTEAFVDDERAEGFSVYENFDDALEHALSRVDYYLNEA